MNSITRGIQLEYLNSIVGLTRGLADTSDLVGAVLKL